jgi:hypothetical protein
MEENFQVDNSQYYSDSLTTLSVLNKKRTLQYDDISRPSDSMTTLNSSFPLKESNKSEKSKVIQNSGGNKQDMKEAKKEREKYYCYVDGCSKSYKYLYNFNSHLLEHGISNYDCRVCNMRFNKYLFLKKHMKSCKKQIAEHTQENIHNKHLMHLNEYVLTNFCQRLNVNNQRNPGFNDAANNLFLSDNSMFGMNYLNNQRKELLNSYHQLELLKTYQLLHEKDIETIRLIFSLKEFYTSF